MRRAFKLVTRFAMITAVLLCILWAYNFSIFNKKVDSKGEDILRIGYLNLHAKAVSSKDLARLQLLDCELWVFLEWNGDNLPDHFLKNYHPIINQQDKKTFGTLILSKDSNLAGSSISNIHYVCNYSQFKLESKNHIVYVLHAPPPLPACGYQNEQYISDFSSYLSVNSINSKPIFIVGDLNAIPMSSSIKYITKLGFISADDHLQSKPHGTLSINTWLPKFIKVDYLFLSDKHLIKSIHWYTIGSSDHAGFTADILIK